MNQEDCSQIDQDSVVYVVDDDASICRAIGRLLKAHGNRTEIFSSADEFLKKVVFEHPSCLILDVQMPGLDGLELQANLKRLNLTIPIIFLTAHGDIPMSVRAMKLGAADFICKPFEASSLIQAVARALKQDRETLKFRAEREKIEARMNTLTKREQEVMRYVIAGFLNKQIATRLDAAEKTIKVHRGRVMQKMKAESLADLVRMAERVNIVPAK
ncbi:MAG: response regulator transcription factor [Planctomycetales bacterium]|nr:response regulator transcription factor [Planctomycetales bacterium]